MSFTLVRNVKSKILLINFLSVLFFTIVDFSYFYSLANALYEENQLLDLLYMLPPVAFSFTAMLESTGKYELNVDSNEIKNINIYTGRIYLVPAIFVVLLVINFFVYSANNMHSDDSFYMLFIMTIYLFLSMMHKDKSKNKEMLEYHKMVNNELENKIEERTKELKDANTQLIMSINTDPLTNIGSRGYLVSVLDENDGYGTRSKNYSRGCRRCRTKRFSSSFRL